MRPHCLFTIFIIILQFLILSCNKEITLVQEGKIPVYANESEFYAIGNLPNASVQNTGTLYVWKNYLMIVESSKGIHIFDNTIPTRPSYLTFIYIPGCIDFTINSNAIYVDNGYDIVVLRADDVMKISVNTIIKDATRPNLIKPPYYSGPYQCVDDQKGYVKSWVNGKIDKPICKTN